MIEESSISSCEGRCPSNEGREDVGDFMETVDVWDFERNESRIVGLFGGCTDSVAVLGASNALGTLVDRL